MDRCNYPYRVWAHCGLALSMACVLAVLAHGRTLPKVTGANSNHLVMKEGESDPLALPNNAVAASRRRWETSRSSADALNLTTALFRASLAHQQLGRMGTAMAYLDEAASLTAEMTDATGMALHGRIKTQQATCSRFLGEYVVAHRQLGEAEKTVDHFERLFPSLAGTLVCGEFITKLAVASGVVGVPEMPPVSRLELLSLRGEVYLHEDNAGLAAGLFEDLVRRRERVYRSSGNEEDGRLWAEALRLQAMAAYVQKDYHKYVALQQQVLERYDAVTGKAEQGRYPFLADAGVGALRLGDLTKAVEYLRAAKKSLNNQRTGAGRWSPPEWTVTTNLAIALTVQGDDASIEEAVTLLQETLDSEERANEETLPLLTTQQRWNYLSSHRWTLGAYLSAAIRAGQPHATIYNRVLKFKAAAFISQIRERVARTEQPFLASAILGSGTQPGAFGGIGGTAATACFLVGWSTAPQDQLANWVEELVALMQLPGEAPLRDKRMAELRERINQLDRFYCALGGGNTKKALPAAVTVEQVAKALPKGTAFIDWVEAHVIAEPQGNAKVRTEQRLMGFVVRPDGTVVAIPYRVSASSIGELIQQWLNELGNNEVAGLNDVGRQIAEVVWAPVNRHLPAGEIRRLVLSPDGNLWRFPFAALPVGASRDRYLVQDYWIGMVMSGHQLIAKSRISRDRPQRQRRALVVGNVAYPNKDERRNMSELLDWHLQAYGKNNVTSLTEEKATRRAVLRAFVERYDDVLLTGHVYSGPLGPSHTTQQPGLGLSLRTPLSGVYFPLAQSEGGDSDYLVPEHFGRVRSGLLPFQATPYVSYSFDGRIGRPLPDRPDVIG